MLSKDKIKNLLSNPNKLTLYRMAAIPGIVLLLMFPKHCPFVDVSKQVLHIYRGPFV
jgi:phosphatidylglycerophosphate synthase